jgi:hypothetical protein
VDEQQRRRVRPRFEEIDAVPLAMAISEVDMIGPGGTKFGRATLPAGNHVAASCHRRTVIEAAVEVLLVHAAPIGRVKRRHHVQVSTSRWPFHFAAKCFKGLLYPRSASGL